MFYTVFPWSHTAVSCKFFYWFMLLRPENHQPREEIIFCNLHKPIHFWRLQPALCLTFRKSVLQVSPQWKTGQTSCWKSMVWYNYLEWENMIGSKRKKKKKRKKKCYACVIEFDTTCALWVAIFAPRIDGFKGACHGNKIWLNGNVWLSRSEPYSLLNCKAC